MEIFKHILEREAIHFFSGAGVFLMAFFAWEYACYRVKGLRAPYGYNALLVPTLLTLICIAFFEFTNIGDGGLVIKSFIDMTTWMIGMGVGMYGIIRKAETVLGDPPTDQGTGLMVDIVHLSMADLASLGGVALVWLQLRAAWIKGRKELQDRVLILEKAETGYKHKVESLDKDIVRLQSHDDRIFNRLESMDGKLTSILERLARLEPRGT